MIPYIGSELIDAASIPLAHIALPTSDITPPAALRHLG
jgi:hypothetical protein